MNRVIQLMGEKNHFLEKFMSLNEKQIARLEQGHFDQIEHFYNQREDLIKIIKYIDSETNKAQMQQQTLGKKITEPERAMIRENLKTKDIYTSKILDQDMQVLALIDRAKTQIIKELQDVRHGQRAMSGYKANVA
jgi:hypothetical protein